MTALTPPAEIPPPRGPPVAAFGRRGSYLGTYPPAQEASVHLNIAAIPGVEVVPGSQQVPGVPYTFGGYVVAPDTAGVVAQRLGLEPPAWPPTAYNEVMTPGIWRYWAYGFHTILRGYQHIGVNFLAHRGGAILADPMRSGKTVMTVAAAELVDARKVVIIAPSIAKYVWAKEIAQWTGQEAIIVEGRSLREARIFCRQCLGIGYLPDEGNRKCPRCRVNGRSHGSRRLFIHALTSQTDGRYHCPKHTGVGTTGEMGPQVICYRCREEFYAKIDAARYIIANFDILIQHKHRFADRVVERWDMPGWTTCLQLQQPDLVVADEAHRLRTRPRFDKQSSVAKFMQMVRQVERVWLLTGTPIYSYIRDLYQLASIATGGLWGTGDQFDLRYCEGRKGDHGGWENRGKTFHAMPGGELEQRLQMIMLKRNRKDLQAELPDKIREVVDVDVPEKDLLKIKKQLRGKNAQVVERLLQEAFQYKKEAVLENVSEEVAEGCKVVVFTTHRAPAKELYDAFEKIFLTNPKTKGRYTQYTPQVWLGDGRVGNEARFKMAEAFVRHKGAGVFVSTVSAMEVAISLKGATSVHFAELSYSAMAMAQAEDRPYDGVTGLTVVYYRAKGTPDDGVLQKIETKVEHAQTVKDANAASMGSALFPKETEAQKKAAMEDLWSRITALAADDDDD